METDTFSVESLFNFLFSKDRIISIIGMEKNIGKTTLLNYLLDGFVERKQPALILSIGKDGESIDSIEQTKKPEIKIEKGICFLTIKELVHTPSSVEILDTFDIKVSGSKVLLARALESTQIQLINPGNQKDLKRLIQKSLKMCGKCSVLIDGALDRLSHGSSSLIDGVFVCAGVQTEGTLSQIVEKTRVLINNLENRTCDFEIKKMILHTKKECGTILIRNRKVISCIPGTLLDSKEMDEKFKNNDILYTSGVLTDKIIRRLFDKNVNLTIVLIDGTKCHLSQKYLIALKRKGLNVQVLNRIPVYGIAINSVGIRRSMNPSEVLRAFQKSFVGKWVIDTQYLA